MAEQVTYTNVLRYECTHTSRSFYIEQVPIEPSREQRSFLWHSQKWRMAVIDESKVSKITSPYFRRETKRREKEWGEGDRYDVKVARKLRNVVTKPLEVIEPDDDDWETIEIATPSDDVPQEASLQTVEDVMWKARGADEQFLLVGYEGRKIANVPFVWFGPNSTASAQFDKTYESSNFDASQNFDCDDEAELATMTFTTEKLIRVVKAAGKHVYVTTPINIKLSYDAAIIQPEFYRSVGGYKSTQFQISEAVGRKSCESRTLQLNTRGGILSDISLSVSEVRSLRSLFGRKKADAEKEYEYIPDDMIVIDKVGGEATNETVLEPQDEASSMNVDTALQSVSIRLKNGGKDRYENSTQLPRLKKHQQEEAKQVFADIASLMEKEDSGFMEFCNLITTSQKEHSATYMQPGEENVNCPQPQRKVVSKNQHGVPKAENVHVRSNFIANTSVVQKENRLPEIRVSNICSKNQVTEEVSEDTKCHDSVHLDLNELQVEDELLSMRVDATSNEIIEYEPDTETVLAKENENRCPKTANIEPSNEIKPLKIANIALSSRVNDKVERSQRRCIKNEIVCENKIVTCQQSRVECEMDIFSILDEIELKDETCWENITEEDKTLRSYLEIDEEIVIEKVKRKNKIPTEDSCALSASVGSIKIDRVEAVKPTNEHTCKIVNDKSKVIEETLDSSEIRNDYQEADLDDAFIRNKDLWEECENNFNEDTELSIKIIENETTLAKKDRVLKNIPQNRQVHHGTQIKPMKIEIDVLKDGHISSRKASIANKNSLVIVEDPIENDVSSEFFNAPDFTELQIEDELISMKSALPQKTLESNCCVEGESILQKKAGEKRTNKVINDCDSISIRSVQIPVISRRPANKAGSVKSTDKNRILVDESVEAGNCLVKTDERLDVDKEFLSNPELWEGLDKQPKHLPCVEFFAEEDIMVKPKIDQNNNKIENIEKQNKLVAKPLTALKITSIQRKDAVPQPRANKTIDKSMVDETRFETSRVLSPETQDLEGIFVRDTNLWDRVETNNRSDIVSLRQYKVNEEEVKRKPKMSASTMNKPKISASAMNRKDDTVNIPSETQLEAIILKKVEKIKTCPRQLRGPRNCDLIQETEVSRAKNKDPNVDIETCFLTTPEAWQRNDNVIGVASSENTVIGQVIDENIKDKSERTSTKKQLESSHMNNRIFDLQIQPLSTIAETSDIISHKKEKQFDLENEVEESDISCLQVSSSCDLQDRIDNMVDIKITLVVETDTIENDSEQNNSEYMKKNGQKSKAVKVRHLSFDDDCDQIDAGLLLKSDDSHDKREHSNDYIENLPEEATLSKKSTLRKRAKKMFKKLKNASSNKTAEKQQQQQDQQKVSSVKKRPLKMTRSNSVDSCVLLGTRLVPTSSGVFNGMYGSHGDIVKSRVYTPEVVRRSLESEVNLIKKQRGAYTRSFTSSEEDLLGASRKKKNGSVGRIAIPKIFEEDE